MFGQADSHQKAFTKDTKKNTFSEKQGERKNITK